MPLTSFHYIAFSKKYIYKGVIFYHVFDLRFFKNVPFFIIDSRQIAVASQMLYIFFYQWLPFMQAFMMIKSRHNG